MVLLSQRTCQFLIEHKVEQMSIQSDCDTVRLVWIDRSDFMRDWLLTLLGPLVGEEAIEAPWPDPQPHSLYVVDTNWYPLSKIPKSFLLKAEQTPGIGLLHLDEWLNEDYSAYRHFAYVLRLHQARGMDNLFIRSLPQGFPTGSGEVRPFLPASQRKVSWFFAGTAVSSRRSMLAHMSRVSGGHFHISGGRDGKRLPHAEYLSILSESTFLPAPMGNVILEAGRVYEALQTGGIPVVEKRLTLDYFERLYGKNPIPSFYTWGAAARFVADMRRRPADCDALQAELQDWWNATKAKLQIDTQAFVRDGNMDLLRIYARRYRPKQGFRRLFWQYSELLRHQSLPSLSYRIRRMLARGSLKRDMSHLDRPRY